MTLVGVFVPLIVREIRVLPGSSTQTSLCRPQSHGDTYLPICRPAIPYFYYFMKRFGVCQTCGGLLLPDGERPFISTNDAIETRRQAIASIGRRPNLLKADSLIMRVREYVTVTAKISLKDGRERRGKKGSCDSCGLLGCKCT